MDLIKNEVSPRVEYASANVAEPLEHECDRK